MRRGCLQFVIVVFPDHTHLLFFIVNCVKEFDRKVFEKISSSSKLRVIIDYSFLIGQVKVNKSKIKLQDKSDIEFHTRRLTRVLFINRYSFLN